MSINLVSAGAVSQGFGSVNPAFGEATESGNFLLAWAQSNNNTASVFPITNETAGWDLIVTTGTDYNWAGLWAKGGSGAGETAPTFADSGFTLNSGLLEFSGIVTSNYEDQIGNAVQADPATCANPDNAGGDLIVALSVWNGANAGPTLGQTLYGSAGTALTSLVAQSNSGGSAGMFYIVSYQQNNLTTGAHGNSVSASASEYEGYVSSLIASFKAA